MDSICIFDSILIGSDLKWRQLKANSKINPKKLYGCTLDYLDGYLYLICGYSINEYTNKIWRYNISSKIWNLRYKGDVLPRLYGHRSIVYGSKYVIIFGGCGNTEESTTLQFYNDMYVYNVETNTVTLMDVGNKPCKRFGFRIAMYDGYLLIYGGKNSELNVINDLYAIKMDDVIHSQNVISWIYINLDELNINLCGSTMTNIGNKLLFYGGKSKNNYRNSNVFRIYNPDVLMYPTKLGYLVKWYIDNIQTEFNMNIPNGIGIEIQKFCGIIYTKDSFNIKERSGHCHCILNIKGIQSLVIFGGFCGRDWLNDMYYIPLEML